MGNLFKLYVGVQCFIALSCLADTVKLPVINVDVVSTPEVVFAWSKDRCDARETSDEPARAFRDNLGRVHLFASQERWREFVGTSLNTLVHRCDVVYQARGSLDPSEYSAFQWSGAFFTHDGVKIGVLAHNEFDGNLRPDVCPSRIYARCWQNTLTMVVSYDGGQTFSSPKAPGNFVAGLPYRYEGEIGHPTGYFQPSNLVELNGYQYALVTAMAYKSQMAGTCVIRSKDPFRPGSWRAWNGFSFEARFSDPYVGPVSKPQDHTCAPLSESLGSMGGVVKDPKSGVYLLVSLGGATDGSGKNRVGIIVSGSYDFIHWTRAKMLIQDPSGASTAGDPRVTNRLPSIMDARSTSLTFSTLAGEPYLYYVRLNLNNMPYDRELVRVRIKIEVD